MSNSNKSNTATKSNRGQAPVKAAFSNLKPDEIQVLLLYRRARDLKSLFKDDIKSIQISLETDPILIVKDSADQEVGADEFIRRKNNDDPIVISNLRLSQVKKRAKVRFNKEINSLGDLSEKEKGLIVKSNRSFLQEKEKKKNEKGKTPQASSSQENWRFKG